MRTSTREHRRRAKHERILTVARAEVLAGGVEGLSLRAVARRARCSPAGLYEHFDSKEHLVRELRLHASAALDRAVARSGARGRTTVERLVEMGLAYVRFARRHPEEFLLLFARASDRRSLARDVPPGSAYGLMRSAVGAVLGLDRSHAVQLEAFTYGFWSTVHGMAMLRLTHLAGFRADFEMATRLVLESIAEAWSRRPPPEGKGE